MKQLAFEKKTNKPPNNNLPTNLPIKNNNKTHTSTMEFKEKNLYRKYLYNTLFKKGLLIHIKMFYFVLFCFLLEWDVPT